MTPFLPFLARGVGYVIRRFLVKYPYIYPVTMFRVKAEGLMDKRIRDINIVNYIPHHHAHYKQFQGKPQVAAPFIFYLLE